MHHSLHNLYIHRSLSLLGTAFAVAHVVLAAKDHVQKNWVWYLHSGAFTASGLAISGTWIFVFWFIFIFFIYYYFYLLIVFLFKYVLFHVFFIFLSYFQTTILERPNTLLGVIGVLLSLRKFLHPTFHRILCSFHVPFAFVGLVGLFGHRFESFGNLKDFLFLGFVIVCLLLFSGFYFFNSIDSCRIDTIETEWGGRGMRPLS